MSELSRDEILDDLVATTRGRDVIHDLADRAIEQREILAEGLRRIRDTTDGAGASIAAHVLAEANVPEPDDG